MYKPKFNKVLVEIDDADAQWGKSSESNPLTDAFREGKVVELGELLFGFGDTARLNQDTLEVIADSVKKLVGKQIMWHEGHEAGTVFEENGKKYALIYWWDIIGEKE